MRRGSERIISCELKISTEREDIICPERINMWAVGSRGEKINKRDNLEVVSYSWKIF